MPFNIGLSGLNAAANDLAITGNNIANAGTIGFKLSRAEFADVYNAAFGTVFSNPSYSGAIGGGVRFASAAQQFNQGNFQFTGNALDLAVSGSGFFVVEDQSTGGEVYTRAGAFRIDRDGFVVNNYNQRLQVFSVVDDTIPSFNTGATSDLQLPATVGVPSPTSTTDMSLNLDADADSTLTAAGFLATDPQTYNHSTSYSVYDSLGAEHTATMYFVNEGGTWETFLYIDGSAVADQVGQVALDFDASGVMTTAMPVDFGTFTPTNGALDIVFDDVDFTGTTQLAGDFATNALVQNGYPIGRLVNIDVAEDGIISARYSNGQSDPLGQLALATFANPQGLSSEGDTSWSETFAAGEAVLGSPGSGGYGLVQAGGLEQSNVEISEQLVNLITAQRNYQANAQTISAADTITQTIINI